MTRPAPGRILNAAAWAVVGLLIVAAILVVQRLGPVGLVLLGGATWLVCSLARLDQDAPTWGVEVFRARLRRPARPEDQAAMLDDRRRQASPLDFYGRCGMLLVALGVLGTAWQFWSP